MDKSKIEQLFGRYQSNFAGALAGDIDRNEFTRVYAPVFIAANPLGVETGVNDDQLIEAMEQGFAYYRAIGTKEMRLRGVDTTQIDEGHCLARVSWTAVYDRTDGEEIAIDFDVSYLVRQIDTDLQIFGWITGDEQAALREHGIIE